MLYYVWCFLFFVLLLWDQEEGSEDLLQNDLRILAALSHSISMVDGQKASEPRRFVTLLMGTLALVLH